MVLAIRPVADIGLGCVPAAHRTGGDRGTIGRAAQHAVQARIAGHLDDGGNAAPFLAHENAPGVLQLHFRAGVAAVADLVLEALHT